ncbi:MAG: LpxL/LpxP family Kdo(2)-lipid IV(A) lauroyl/palmitoleoyl acyltransferase [Gammaproteobacteria bacterium]|jgi:KDO2-lipid IV(A) lauroyltransferase
MGSDDSRFWWLRFLAPRFWPTWLMFGALRIVIQLPFAWQMAVGSLIGALALRLAVTRRHVAGVNLRLCFPQSSAAERERLLKAHFDALGKGVIETALCWWGRSSRLRKKVCLVGLEHLQQARAQGRGVILLSAHFTALELGGRLLALHSPFHVLYRKHRNPLFETVMQRARQRRFEKAIPRDDTRALIASLKAGMPVWYAPDQNHAGPQSRFVPFFGLQASTLTATSRLARLSGASVVPFFQARLPGDAGYLLVLCPALDQFPTDDIEQDTSRINCLIEGVIREIPEQYLWVHRRFKSRPEGEAYPYG